MEIDTNEIFTENLAHPGGFVEAVRDQIMKTAACPQIKFATGAAISLAGTLYGRQVETEDGLRTNVFCVNVGYSSGGKDHPLKMVAQILDSCSASHMRMGQVTSDSALEYGLKRQPCQIMIVDEFGHFMGYVTDSKNKGSCQSTIKPMLLQIWSSADGVYVGKQRVPRDGKEVAPIVINNPHVCLLGATQPQIIFGSMTTDDLRDGWLPRNLLFISKERIKPRGVTKEVIPNAIKQVVFEWKTDLPQPALYTIPYTAEAKQAFDEFGDEVFEYMLQADKAGCEKNYIFGKAVENAKRIALILSASQFGKAAVMDGVAQITKEHAEYSILLVQAVIMDTLEMIDESLGTNQDEKNKKFILKLIAQQGKKGMLKSEITAKTQFLNSSTRNSYLDDLVEAGEVVKMQLVQAGGGIRFYLQGLKPVETLSPEKANFGARS